jgi:hypothetical protein
MNRIRSKRGRSTARSAASAIVSIGLLASLAACGGASATAMQSAARGASPGGPSLTPPATTPTATRVQAPTPSPTPTGGMSWQEAGTISFGGIIAVPNGYLASCDVESAGTVRLCSSRNLLTWQSPPDPAMYVNAGGRPFLPAGTVAVKSGYGARGGLGQAHPIPEWYSSDGVHWQEGIPADQIVGPCMSDATRASGCAWVVFAVSSPNSPIAFAYVSGSSARHVLVSNDGWSTWEDVTLPTDWTSLDWAQPPLALPDGSWVAAATAPLPARPSGPAVIGEPPPDDLITTRDGVNWQSMPGYQSPAYLAVLGTRIFVSTGGAQGRVTESQDGGQSWSVVRNAADGLYPYYITTLDGHLLVFDGDVTFSDHLLWIGTPTGE